SCVEELELVQCRECGYFHRVEDSNYDSVNSDYVCEDCFDDGFSYCEECGEIVNQYNQVWIKDTEVVVCEDCADKHYYECDDCGEWFSEANTDSSGTVICESCFDNYTYCEDCEDIIHYDDLYSDNYGCYCESCWYENGHNDSDIIQEYHSGHDDGVRFFELVNGEEDSFNCERETLYYGVELEVDNGSNRGDTAREVKEILGEEVLHMENDVSLNCGFEMIFQPSTIDCHMSRKENMELAFKELKRNGFQGHDATTTGLHFHVNRSQFNEEEIAKILFVVSNLWDNIVTFSRRSEAQLSKWSAKNCDNSADIEYLKSLTKEQRSRYLAVNLNNKKTIEFRFCRSTLNIETFYASLQLIDTICRVCKEKSLLELQSMTFANMVNATNYSELKEYALKKELL
ncbi:MAG: hypothetical protein ACRDD8_05640, partial [Bacteroidales bacterium]